MLGPGIDAQIRHLLAAERAARKHALHGLLEDALRERPSRISPRRALLDAAGMAGVPVVELCLRLLPVKTHLLGVDDDDIVAAVHMRRVGGLMLAAQAMAMIDARRPTTRPSASITIHFFSISAGFAE